MIGTAANTTPSKLEQAEIEAVESLKPTFESPPVKAVGRLGKLGDEPPLQFLSGAVLVVGLLSGKARLRNAGIRMLTAHTIATGLKTFVKNRVDRTRPAELDRRTYRAEPGRSGSKGLRSFPSGHAAGLAAVAKAVSREYAVGPAAAAIAGSLATLQIVRRAHYPSDALAGAAIGLLAEAVADRLLAPLLRRSGG